MTNDEQKKVAGFPQTEATTDDKYSTTGDGHPPRKVSTTGDGHPATKESSTTGDGHPPRN